MVLIKAMKWETVEDYKENDQKLHKFTSEVVKSAEEFAAAKMLAKVEEPTSPKTTGSPGTGLGTLTNGAMIKNNSNATPQFTKKRLFIAIIIMAIVLLVGAGVASYWILGNGGNESAV